MRLKAVLSVLLALSCGVLAWLWVRTSRQDAEIRSLNLRYRKLDRATDVLSFHQQELRGVTDPAGDRIFLGDIVISVETALRRAGARRLPGELARLGIHGLLHLFGHDHHRPTQAKVMRALESRLLRGTRTSGR